MAFPSLPTNYLRRAACRTIETPRLRYHNQQVLLHQFSSMQRNYSHSFRTPSLAAKPKRGNVVESYQTVSVNCSKCGFRLFRYKKKNGTKSNLVKCFVERIAEDCGDVLSSTDNNNKEEEAEEDAAVTTATITGPTTYACPSCDTVFARAAMIRGMPALKLVGGKTRMTKK